LNKINKSFKNLFEFGEGAQFHSLRYSNGKRNGKGIEYNEAGKLIFEGEYLNGKKYNGFEKEYDENNGNLIFEYEYVKGERVGFIKEYDKYNEKLIFFGKYLNGKRNMEGKEYRLLPIKIHFISQYFLEYI